MRYIIPYQEQHGSCPARSGLARGAKAALQALQSSRANPGMKYAMRDSLHGHCDPGAARIPAPFASLRQT
jgi:hypothetical protein